MEMLLVNCAASPVESHALYDGQLIPLRDRRRLVPTSVCGSCSQQFRATALPSGGAVNSLPWLLPSSLSSLSTTVGQELGVSASA